MKGQLEITNEVDLCELSKEARSLDDRAPGRFQEICVQIAEEVKRTGGGEIWFKSKEERDKVLKMTLNELMGNAHKALNGMTLEEIVKNVNLGTLNYLKGIGPKKAEEIKEALSRVGFNVPQA